ncbi:3-hydroxyacyl-ACP dehydratase FabZ family protein [Reyranella sp. CPCC 100927]|uniref:3-hydroxyacyl-ACP dehydratase FabZ family protein n=1 Tax=Reyranella sp. CPCC 100927 TaxID=2599616 RepID=UPI0011B847EC|nr:hypothetical protein [Reyranella sp. CPCC 100927]TWT13696.1 hypothetical protein FQU96_07200 [Reyranella sp. CPCC 100927]
MDTAPLAQIICRDAQSVTLQLQLSPDLACFAGHFPDFPVLPGVVQVDWALQLATTYLGVTADGGIRLQVKHKRIVLPSSPLTLELRVDQPGRLRFSYRSADVLVTEGSVVLVGL